MAKSIADNAFENIAGFNGHVGVKVQTGRSKMELAGFNLSDEHESLPDVMRPEAVGFHLLGELSDDRYCVFPSSRDGRQIVHFDTIFSSLRRMALMPFVSSADSANAFLQAIASIIGKPLQVSR